MTKKEFRQLADYIRENYGIYLKEEKQSMLSGRLQNLLIEKGFRNFTDYYKYVISDKTEEAAIALINRVTTNHTFFMREEEHFKFFKETVLPDIVKKAGNKDLRIWSAGCSSGEEPYTLAIIIDEFFGKEKLFWDSKILATDISSRMLEKAQKRIYGNEEIAALPVNWRLSYFSKYDQDRSVISDRIRNEVIFRRFNLMEKCFPFKRKFHVIFCRNVMIYFNNETKWELLENFQCFALQQKHQSPVGSGLQQHNCRTLFHTWSVQHYGRFSGKGELLILFQDFLLNSSN